MSHIDFPLLCGRGGQKSISFHALYVTIKNSLHDSIESSIIPYHSICFVFEEHLNTADHGLRRVNIHLNCGVTHTLETAQAEQAEEILVHLLKNTLVQSKGMS